MSATLVLERTDRAKMLAEYAELRRDAVKDKSYRLTPIGKLAGRFLDEIAFNSYSDRTVEGRESILARLALDFADHELAEIVKGDLTDFLAEHWGGCAHNTRATNHSHVKTFFDWAYADDHIPVNPARNLKAPRAQDTERVSHSPEDVRTLIRAQPSLRDRCGLLTLYWCGLRRNELRAIQWRHVDLANRVLTVFGKGATVLEQNIPEPLGVEYERLILYKGAKSDDYLLYPQKVGRYGQFPVYSEDVIWEDPTRPLSVSAIDKWWQRCVARSGLDHFPMHELRHTAGTHFHQAGHDIVATQHFLRHKNPATTIRTYIHTDRVRSVADVQRRMVDPMEDR